ncbi:unnamed protein product [Rotaria magnacalcarata]|uniref:Uncharacterized protein n=1 Tax=Rotaria magnacalcarata TaxID=392030 RepID=A0A815P132_9BILA|nr:unnamed protein product [Rotaria magnacalcarata]CAF1439997.1 unnamed protein product [Rotaria magnacalcarata]CAF4007267.1 unnamed protein product [Rotaria magnacalcarata]CAF4030035.1 unnamed protein product [Rotaria magnacalcarata]
MPPTPPYHYMSFRREVTPTQINQHQKRNSPKQLTHILKVRRQTINSTHSTPNLSFRFMTNQFYHILRRLPPHLKPTSLSSTDYIPSITLLTSSSTNQLQNENDNNIRSKHP